MTGTRTVALEIMEPLEWQQLPLQEEEEEEEEGEEEEDEQQQQRLSLAFVLNANAFTGTEIY